MACNLLKFFEDENKKRENAKIKLPEALSKQKRKFLISINKCDEEFSQEDEEFVKKVMGDLYEDSLLPMFDNSQSYPWNDSFADKLVNISWEKNAVFDLNNYLDCVRTVFLTYSGVSVNTDMAAEYVLRHARRFGDSSKTIFQTSYDSANASNQQNVSVTSNSVPLPRSKFMDKIEQLIADLRSSYDETKFRILNTNATYITLLILRRFVKKEAECAAAYQRIHTHDSYVKLCPWPLDNQLPKCDTSKLTDWTLKKCAYLAVHAYLNTDDERTKRALRVTCVQYMEWNGLQLPNLFFKVVELYQIDAGKLWELLCIEKTAKSLMRFANEYYEKFQTLKGDPTKTQRWFPFCRIFHGNYHKTLSAPQNIVICLILAYLIDLKLGIDNSTVSLSHWAKSEPMWREPCQKFAETLIKRLNQ